MFVQGTYLYQKNKHIYQVTAKKNKMDRCKFSVEERISRGMAFVQGTYLYQKIITHQLFKF